MNNISPESIPNTLIGELERMRSLAAGEAVRPSGNVDPDNNFSALMRKQIDDVNALQKESAKLAELFEIGDENVSLVDVMIAGQKSKVAFSALVEVRNKMLTAYQEIMSMQV